MLFFFLNVKQYISSALARTLPRLSVLLRIKAKPLSWPLPASQNSLTRVLGMHFVTATMAFVLSSKHMKLILASELLQLLFLLPNCFSLRSFSLFRPQFKCHLLKGDFSNYPIKNKFSSTPPPSHCYTVFTAYGGLNTRCLFPASP